MSASATTVDATGAVAAPTRVRRSQMGDTLRRAGSMWRTRVGLVIVAVVVGIALIGPWITPESPTAFVGVPYAPPGDGAVFGTDALGRDVLSRFLAGGRVILLCSLLATLIGVGIGAIFGLAAAYGRGAVDTALMRFSDVLLAFPQIVLVLLAVSTVGPKLWLIVVMVGLSHLPRTARVIRGTAVEIVERDFIKAAEVSGEKRWRIVVADLLPNVSSPLLVEFGLRLTSSIALIAAIAFLGFGPQPPAADWGLMMNENRVGITAQPWAVVLPIVAVALLTIGTNLVTDGIARVASGVDRGRA